MIPSASLFKFDIHHQISMNSSAGAGCFLLAAIASKMLVLKEGTTKELKPSFLTSLILLASSENFLLYHQEPNLHSSGERTTKPYYEQDPGR
jgi:hypothetical protein